MSSSINPNIPDPNDPALFTTPVKGATPTTPSLALTTTSQQQDTLDTSTIPGPTAKVISAEFPVLSPISILNFAQIQSSATSTSSEQQYLQEQANAVAMNDFYEAGIIEGLGLVNSNNALVNILNSILGPIFGNPGQSQNIANLEAAIAAYDPSLDVNEAQVLNETVTALNAATSNLAAAQAALDADPTNKQLQEALVTAQNAYTQAQDANAAAVLTYNAYVDAKQPALDALNEALMAYNSGAEAINNAISNYDNNLAIDFPNNPGLFIEPIPMPDIQVPYSLPPATADTTMTILPIPFPTAANGNLIPTNQAILVDMIQAQIIPGIIGNIALLTDSTNIYQNISEYTNFIAYYFNFNPNHLVALPNSFTTPQIQAFIAGLAGASTGSGISLGTLISSLNNPLLTTVLDRAVFSSLSFGLEETYSQRLVESFQFLNLINLVNAGMAAGVSAMAQYNEIGPMAQLAFMEETSPAIDVAIGLAYLNQVSFVVNSDNLRDAVINQIANEYPMLSPDQLVTEATQVIAASNLFALQMGLSAAAQALNNPYLFGQVMATLDNASYLENALYLSQQPLLSDVLSNPISLAFINQYINNLYVNNQLEFNANSVVSQDIQNVENNVFVNGLYGGSFATPGQIQDQLIDSFEASGIDPSTAAVMASQAAAYVEAEAGNNYALQTGFVANTFNQEYAVNALVSQAINFDTASASVAAFMGGDLFAQEITYRDARDALADQMMYQGVPPDQAFLAANEAVFGNLNVAFTFNVLPLETLTAEIENTVIGQLGPTLGNLTAQIYADQILAAVIENRQLMDAQLAVLVAQENAQLLTTVNEKTAEFIKPNPEGFAVNEMLMSPGKSLLQISGKHGASYTIPTDLNV